MSATKWASEESMDPHGDRFSATADNVDPSPPRRYLADRMNGEVREDSTRRPVVMIPELESIDPAKLAEICSRYGVCELSVFGSAVRGGLTTDSDIDLLVVFDLDSKVGLVRFGQPQEELPELFGRHVDLVSKDGLKPLIRDEVLSAARLLYAA